MPKFTVLVRAMRHLTAELSIEADTEDNARAEAEGRLAFGNPAIEWDERDPWDKQVEGISENA